MSQICDYNIEGNLLFAGPDNPARKVEYPTAHQKANPLNPSARGVKEEFIPAARDVLRPICPDPQIAFQPLSSYQVEYLTGKVMKHLRKICETRGTALDFSYWKHMTRQILSSTSPEETLIVPSPAGSGKSTWILAFNRTLIEVCQKEPEFGSSLVGTLIVLQKVSDLNELASELNSDAPEDDPPMIALQGWSVSGQKMGFCRNANVHSYDECQRAKCPFALGCQLLSFQKEATSAPVVGVTQERFYMLRSSGNLDMLLYRLLPGGRLLPRRYIIFDEKHQMAQIHTLTKPLIDQASTEFNTLIRKVESTDSNVRSLQQRLGFCVERTFQALRSRLCISTEQGVRDIPAGVFTLTQDEELQNARDYFQFQDSLLSRQTKYLTKSLREVFDVMSYVYEGRPFFFSKTNGFCIFHITPPKLCYGQCQTILFDATAEVDADYRCLDHVRFLHGRPERVRCTVTYEIHDHPDLNVSKSAMDKSWKLPAFGTFIGEILRETDGKVFLCTYKSLAEPLADYLKAHLSSEEFSRITLMPDRERPTIPYLGGTNGSNVFNRCTNVIMLGYPRLDPQTYLTFTCAAFGEEQVSSELQALSPQDLLNGSHYNLLSLPSVNDYVTHHLAARLEQEIYRSALRNPDFGGDIRIYLFCPPPAVLSILQKRIPGTTVLYNKLPKCVELSKRMCRSFENGQTSFRKLMDFLSAWDGTPIRVVDLRDRLGISPAVWKDLIADSRIKEWFQDHCVLRSGRGSNTTLYIAQTQCA